MPDGSRQANSRRHSFERCANVSAASSRPSLRASAEP